MKRLNKKRPLPEPMQEYNIDPESQLLELATAAEVLVSLGVVGGAQGKKIPPTPPTTPRTKRKRQPGSIAGVTKRKQSPTTPKASASALHFHPLENSFFASSTPHVPTTGDRHAPIITNSNAADNSNSFLPSLSANNNEAKPRISGAQSSGPNNNSSDCLLFFSQNLPTTPSVGIVPPFTPLSVKNDLPSSLTSSSASTNLPGVSTLLKGTSPSAGGSSALSGSPSSPITAQQPLMFHHHIVHPPQAHQHTTQRYNNNNHNGPQVTKRRRRKTTASECAVLRAAFDSGMYHPPLQLRKELAAAVNMTERQIQVWFQNRRQKLKKGLLPAVTAHPSSPPSSSTHRPITVL